MWWDLTSLLHHWTASTSSWTLFQSIHMIHAKMSKCPRPYSDTANDAREFPPLWGRSLKLVEGREQHMITYLQIHVPLPCLVHICMSVFRHLYIHVYLAFYPLICCLLPHEWLRQNLVALQDLESLRAEMLVTRSLGWCEVEHPKCT